MASPRVWECPVCGHRYDEVRERTPFAELPDGWECPACGAPGADFVVVQAPTEPPASTPAEAYLATWSRASDELERHMADIHRMAETGESIVEAMRTREHVASWDSLLFCGAQLAKLPRNHDEPVSTRTVIGPNARQPLVIETPVFVTHMSFGALSAEAKVALAKGSAAACTAIGSGEGGILPEERAAAYRTIFEVVPNGYSLTEENLRAADAIEIKLGQSAKPGMGGLLPGAKVTQEIAALRGFAAGEDIHSPARFRDVAGPDELRAKVRWLREVSCGRPVGIKLAAGNIEADLDGALYCEPDFVTMDGRPGGTGAAPRLVKAATSVPTVLALSRARRHLDARGAHAVSLIVTGGLRVSPDFARALALGADAVAIGTAALIAIGCQQYRQCNTGRCPVGITTQDPDLRARLDVEASARRLARFLRVCTDELCDFARLTGNCDVHGLSLADLCTTDSAVAAATGIRTA